MKILTKINKVLLRQLMRAKLSYLKMPETIEQWQLLIEDLNRVYIKHNQELYSIEHALKIASQKLCLLNESEENAYLFAGIGNWYFDIATKKINWSSKVCQLLEVNDDDFNLDSDEIIKNYIDKDDWETLNAAIARSLKTGENLDINAKVCNKKTNKCKWVNIRGRPFSLNNKTGEYESLSGVISGIIETKANKLSMSDSNEKLNLCAERASMEEVASSVLHNIGNILNSVNVSVGLVRENFDKTRIEKLERVINMLHDNLPHIQDYLSNDPKGKLLPRFLDESVSVLKSEYATISIELKNILNFIHHMDYIIMKQQDLSKLSGVRELFTINEILDLAVILSLGPSTKLNIRKTINFNNNIKFVGEKHKLMQILINLIGNAEESYRNNDRSKKNIDIIVDLTEGNIIEITIKDYGIGISKEIMKNLFTFGFTTKPDGHGFGLHNCILIAKELGGTLTAESKGINQGSSFKLQIPIEIQRGSDDEKSI